MKYLLISMLFFGALGLKAQTVVYTDLFLLGSDTLSDGSLTADTFLVYDKVKGGFFGGRASHWSRDDIGIGSFAYGSNSMASGKYATAFGDNASAEGDDGAVALGYDVSASGRTGATALGDNTSASGEKGATALGHDTNAEGNSGATALGDRTTASGNNGATALGYNTTANGNKGATALGYRTIANGNVGAVVGMYNDTLVSVRMGVSPTSPLFIVGNGDSGSGNESNAMVVRKNGEVSFENYKFPIDDGTFQQALVSNGSGQINWTDVDISETNELQSLTIFNDDLYVSLGGSPVSLLPYLDNTDDWNNVSSNINFDLGSVGIGDTTPDAFLEIEKNSTGSNPHLLLTETESTDFVRLRFENSSQTGFWTIATKKSATAASNVMILNMDGNPANDFLELRGDGNHQMDGTLTQTSDARLKSNIIKLENRTPDLMSLGGYNYKWKNPQRNQNTQIGLIAQEVQQYFPELVHEDEEGILSVNYIGLVPVLIEGHKEQYNEIKNLNLNIENLEAEITEVFSELRRLQKLILDLQKGI